MLKMLWSSADNEFQYIVLQPHGLTDRMSWLDVSKSLTWVDFDVVDANAS